VPVLVVQGLKILFTDEQFVNLLCVEQLDTLPKCMAEKIQVALLQKLTQQTEPIFEVAAS
jgi:hypothetical protein